MAISQSHYNALRQLHGMGELSEGGALFEIGEANFYGDMPVSVIAEDAKRLGRGQWLVDELRQAVERQDRFVIAKAIYQVFIGRYVGAAIDFGGTEHAHRLDLNGEIDLGMQFDLVINHGTAEHIFNVSNVFKVMHEHCKVGGLMIHESPFTGWVDHGFYTLQPTAYYDVAAANGYEIPYLAVTQLGNPDPLKIECREQIHKLARDNELPDNAMLFAAMRKTADSPFAVPIQGVYAGSISNAAKRSWMELR